MEYLRYPSGSWINMIWLKKYQETNSLKVTGGINAATLEKAGITLTDKQKQQVAAQVAFDAAKKN